MHRHISDERLFATLNLFKIVNYVNHTEDMPHYRETLIHIKRFIVRHWIVFTQRFGVDPLKPVDECSHVFARPSQLEISCLVDLLVAGISGDRDLAGRAHKAMRLAERAKEAVK